MGCFSRPESAKRGCFANSGTSMDVFLGWEWGYRAPHSSAMTVANGMFSLNSTLTFRCFIFLTISTVWWKRVKWNGSYPTRPRSRCICFCSMIIFSSLNQKGNTNIMKTCINRTLNNVKWWCHTMETFSAQLALCAVQRWVPLTQVRDAELWCFHWYAPEYTVEKTIVRVLIWDAIAPIMTPL